VENSGKGRFFPWLRLLVHLLGALPLVWLVFDSLTGSLSVNPIQDFEQRLGRAALYFLVATLAVTPFYSLTGWRQILPSRRTLGLYAFFYACLHFTVFIAIDYGFNIQEIGRLMVEKPFIFAGLISGLLLLALAITSFDFFKRKLGKSWKILHRMVYVAGVLVILHYALAKKGNLFTLSGDLLKPMLWGILVIILLGMRLPAARKWIRKLRESIR
jgi:methionine sulfoxide reductase heme-binding subunit